MRSDPASRNGAVPLRALLGFATAVAILVVIVVQVQGAMEASARRAFAELRTGYAPDSVTVLGPMDEALRETSGLAVSAAYPGVLWSHNDSGDEARFYAVDHTGAVLAVFDLAGVEAQDWEDMDAGPCPVHPSRTCLYLGDIGDNVRRRDVLTVHVVPEPDPDMPADAESGRRVVEPAGRLRYLYPEDSRDAEALAVSPSGDVVLVTKGRAPEILLFHLDAGAVRAAVESDEPLRLAPGHVLPIEPDWDLGRIVTGASFNPDGTVLAVRTLSEIYFFTWPGLGEAQPPCFLGRREPQGEAVAWEPGGSLLLTSETNFRGPGALTRVWCGAS